MAEKDRIDNKELETSESSSIEVLDLVDEIEMVPEEEESVEPLVVLQEEVIGEEADEESSEPNNFSTNHIEPLPILEDAELEARSKP